MAAADYRLMTEATGQRIAAALESLVNLGDPVTIAHGGTGATTAAAALAALGGVAVTDIVNNLTSTATNKPLSAAQGKALNDKIVTINQSQGVAITPNTWSYIYTISKTPSVKTAIRLFDVTHDKTVSAYVDTDGKVYVYDDSTNGQYSGTFVVN